MTVDLRPAIAEDAVPCARILGDWFTATEWLPRLHTPAEDLAHLRRLIGLGHVDVAATGYGAVGFLARDSSEITHFYLDRDWRQQGLGSRLLDRAKRGRASLALWCFQANDGARRFYERHGFVCTQTTDGGQNEEGVPDMRYEWEAPA